jgi:hypothetical protein
MLRTNRNKLPLGYIQPDLAPLNTPQPIRLMNLKYTYRALKTFDWDMAKTARALNISYKTLRNWVTEMRQSGVYIPHNPKMPRQFMARLEAQVALHSEPNE